MDSDSQLLPAPRQQQQLQDPHTHHENLLLPPTASTSKTPGQTRLPDHWLTAEFSLPRSAISASQEFQTATTSATEIPTEARLNHSVSHSHLHLQFSDQQRHGHGCRSTHVRAHILRSYRSSSDLSMHRKERLLPRSAGSSNILRWASANNLQEQDTAKSDPRIINARQGDHAKGLRKDDGISQLKKILTVSKATRKHDRVEIDILEALQTTQTSRKASTSTLREKGNFTNERPQKEVGKKIIRGGISRNGKVPFRSVKKTQTDSGSIASSPSQAPIKPRISICRDIERSFNSFLPMSVNDTNDNSIHEDKSNLISEPAKSELGRLPDQANTNAHQSASDRQDRADIAIGNTCQETEGPTLVVNHPSSGSNSVHDETSMMETTTPFFQLSQFDCDEDFATTAGHLSHDANDVGVPFSESSEITPQLFDDLLPHMHSPFVARYAHFDENFSGATDPHPVLVAALPSRIIAEIASDCLMDYDLVSDFFLTFRGFINSHTLLKILFARLEWSLDRSTADGRIARIRTFAAIRHWVLNYFVDDFLHERDGWILRNEFCSHLNRLYSKMRARLSVVNLQKPETRRGNRKTRPAVVASDLKLLIDLKRCWIGRCDLFCHSMNGLGDEMNGVPSGTGDVFDADRDIEPASTPHDEKGAFCMQKNTSEANLRRFSRYTDVRFSHHGAFRPTDVTAPPPGTKPTAAASFDATSEPGDKSVNSPLDQIGAQAVVRDHHQQRQVGHVKTSSQHSVISFNSTASKGLFNIKRTFSDSVRIGVPTVRRSLSVNDKPRPRSYNDVETTEIQQHKRHALTQVIRGDGKNGDVQRDYVEEPNLSAPVSHNAQRQTPVISVAMLSTLTPAPPENLIRGTLFAPVEGIVHVWGGAWNANPSRNGPGTGDSQSPQYRQRSIRGRQENPRRPLMGGWGSQKNDISSNVGGLMSRDDVSVFTGDTPRTPVRESENHANFRLRCPMQCPERIRPHAGELPKRSITLPVVTTPTNPPSHFNPSRGETHPNAGVQRPTHSYSSAQGVRHIIKTLRRAFVDRKHNHGDNQAVDWSSFDSGSSNGSTKGKSNSSGLARGNTFASRFHLKRNAAHMHHNSGGSQPSQTDRASLDKSRNWESLTNRNKSASVDRRQSPVSHFDTSYIISEADTSVLCTSFPAVKPQSTDCQVAINNPMHPSNHETQDSARNEKPQIQHNNSLRESAGRKGSLDDKAREEALVLSWLQKNKEARLDLLAESAAESYMDRFTKFSDLERQNCSSTATMFTPDEATHSIQIRMARANERNSDCISAEVKRAMAKMAASSTSEPDQQPPNQSSPGLPGSLMSHPRSQSLSHEEGQPQALITHVLSGDHSSMGAAATATVFANPNYQTTEQTLYAGLGFGLDLASRIPRRPSGHRNSVEGTPHLHAANGGHITKSKNVFSRQSPCHNLSTALYQGPDLVIVESAPPSGRDSSDTQRNHGKVSLNQRKSLDPRSLGEGDVNSTKMKGEDLERSVTRTTQGTRGFPSTDHSPPDALPENEHPSERAGAVARSLKSWGNRLRKYASYQSGMSKLDFRRHHEHEERTNDVGEQRHGEGKRGRSFWTKNNHFLPHQHHHSHQLADHTLGQVSHHQLLNVSSLNANEKMNPNDEEATAPLTPMLTLPSSMLQLSLPSPCLFKDRENVHQSSSETQSPRKLRQLPDCDMGNAVTLRPNPSEVDTTKPISDESPYLAADLTWRRSELMDSLSRSQTSGRVCSVDSGKAHSVQPGPIPDFHASHESQVPTQSSAYYDLATFGPSHSTSPRERKQNNSPDAKASPLQPEEGWEQVSVNISPSKPTLFSKYSLHISDGQDCEIPTTIYNDTEANNGSARPMSPSTTLSIISKATIPTSPNDDGEASDDFLSSNDSGISYHSARQDVNAIQNEDQQELPDLSIHDKDYVDAVSVSMNSEGKTLSGENETSACHPCQSEPSIKEYSCREPFATPPSSTENRQLGSIARNETPDTVAPSRPSSTHDEVLIANQVGESQREQPQMPFSGSHATTSHAPPETQVSLPLSTYQHAPFILAYSSKVLAEQFTIIEVAALAEIDWRDLVDMNWSNDQNTLDWACYLTSEDRRGIDVVIARFNLMVKWIVSEIVLTHDISERAGAISKFIHVAIEARRMRNFSTMVQVTIALSSVNCVSLKNTWALVDSDSRHAFEKIEALVQPLRNFKDLRMEMESQGLHEGCVPFVGLYVQDLTYNAQKPPTIHVEGGAQPLVNLERYRTAASIIKNLLRLIDASTRYGLTPVNGVIERCLWISCLKDEDIRLLSKSAEM